MSRKNAQPMLEMVTNDVEEDQEAPQEMVDLAEANSLNSAPESRVVCRLDPEQQEQIEVVGKVLAMIIEECQEAQTRASVKNIEIKLVGRERQLMILDAASMQGFDDLDRTAYYEVDERGRVILAATAAELAARQGQA